ncbi:MAG TPA: hypothetical protein PLQ20_02575 [Candidatus Paceibacterota bacterium]|nr:hypothetical protein [Candidatus Paceibacterota bacterium]
MKRNDLINNIEGSRLKKQFLEAFLLQSAFIEGLLKKLVENNFFSNVTLPVLMQQLKDETKTLENKYIEKIKEKLLRQSLYEIIEHLETSGVIGKDLKKKLHEYRESRNAVLHDLVGKMSGQEFEIEIESLVSKGQEILQNESMVIASNSVQSSEEFLDILNSKDPNKMDEYINDLLKK